MKVKSWEDIRKKILEQEGALLTGNGFAIELSDVFNYKSLYARAREHKTLGKAQLVFDALNETNFENVLHIIESAFKLVTLTEGALEVELNQRLGERLQEVRTALVNSVAIGQDSKSQIEPTRLESCALFLKQFSEYFTTNYDLNAYYVLSNKLNDKFRDGFTERSGTRLRFRQNSMPNVHFLHGALHIYQNGECTEKLKYKDSTPIILEVRRLISEKNLTPLIITEGTYALKEAKIIENKYLSEALKALSEFKKTIVTYGFSFAHNDEHIVRAIEKSPSKAIYIGVYGEKPDKNLKDAAQRLKEAKKTVHFWDTSTADPWGKRSQTDP